MLHRIINFKTEHLPGHELAGRLEEEEDEQGTAGPRVVVDGRSLSWEDLGNLLKPYVGWTLELRLDSEMLPREGDISGKFSVRPPTKTELRAATRSLRQTAGGCFLDSAHYRCAMNGPTVDTVRSNSNGLPRCQPPKYCRRAKPRGLRVSARHDPQRA
jgi:hypothetical protein